MQAATTARLIQALRAELAAPAAHAPFEVPAERYSDAARFEQERALFSGPRFVTASSAIAPGTCHPVDDAGRTALLVRDQEGTLRAFSNACRHRGMRLVDAPCAKKAMVCPYHGWTYELGGGLLHVPHERAFAGIDLTGRGLRALPVGERHGLVWMGEGDVAAYLGEVDDDVAALDLARHRVWKSSRVTRRCNWKLVIEAFLDGYHIRSLHRDSIYRFFLDAASVAEKAGVHVRAVTGRRALERSPEGADLRALATPSLVLFPATVIIAHPDFVSVVDVYPLAANEIEMRHAMLVPDARAGDAEHWDRSWALIEEGVFQREDLWACEQIQRGLDGGATRELLFGALENSVRWLHEAIDRALEESSTRARVPVVGRALP